MIMYANDNQGFLPGTGRRGGSPYPHDWIQFLSGDDLDRSVIGRYLGRVNDSGNTNAVDGIENKTINWKVLRCPSDDVKFRARGDMNPVNPASAYRFSYVMNQYLGAGFLYQEFLKNKNYYDTFGGAFAKDCVAKITQIHHPAEKMMLYEEAEATIDDGHGSADVPGSAVNLLAIRHDRRRLKPEPPGSTVLITTIDSLKSNFNGGLKGNAAFCDGSARYMSRVEMHAVKVCKPKL